MNATKNEISRRLWRHASLLCMTFFVFYRNKLLFLIHTNIFQIANSVYEVRVFGFQDRQGKKSTTILLILVLGYILISSAQATKKKRILYIVVVHQPTDSLSLSLSGESNEIKPHPSHFTAMLSVSCWIDQSSGQTSVLFVLCQFMIS